MRAVDNVSEVALVVLRTSPVAGDRMPTEEDVERRARAYLFERIRAGARVWIETPHGNVLRGRAVMRGPHGWVLNLGGRHGTPGIATERNTLRVEVR